MVRRSYRVLGKCCVILLMLVFLGCGHFVSGNYPPEKKIRHYDSQGKYTGYTIESPWGYRHYDKDGRYKGRSAK